MPTATNLIFPIRGKLGMLFHGKPSILLKVPLAVVYFVQRITPVMTEAKTAAVAVSGNTANALAAIENAAGYEELKAELDRINGSDAYSYEGHAAGKLDPGHYLAVPAGLGVADPGDVGSAATRARIGLPLFALITAMNVDRIKSESAEDRLVGAMLRAGAVSNGWLANQKEVVEREPTDEEADKAVELLADRVFKDRLEDALEVSFLQPLFAECVFRTHGHHYLTHARQDFQERYGRLYAACLAGDLATFAAPDVQYYAALHWVSPGRALEVARALKGEDRLPNAVEVRIDAAPAGFAVLSTTKAVLDAMPDQALRDEIGDAFGVDLDLITEAVAILKAQPERYHIASKAYGVPVLPEEAKRAMDRAKGEAARMAPATQAFIDAVLADGSLGRAQALRKHAENNPAVVAKLQRYFRGKMRAEVSSVSDALKLS
jgi:hypothetical protein